MERSKLHTISCYLNKHIRLGFIIYLIVLSIISFLPFYLAQIDNRLIISVFNGFQYQSFSEYYQVWHHAYLGSYTVLFIPYLLFSLLIFKILPAAVSHIVIMGLIKFLSGITIYILLGTFTKKQEIRILGSFIYLLSIYGQAITGNTPSGGYLFYAVLPGIVYLFITLSKSNFARNLLLYAGLLLIITDTNFTYITYMFILLFGISLYNFFILKNKASIIYFLVFGFIFIGVNLYYYLPLFAYNFIYKSEIISSSLSAETAIWKGSYSSPAEILRLLGSIDFYNEISIKGVEFLARPFFQPFISNPFFIVISFILPLFSLVGLSIAKIKDVNVKSHYSPRLFFLLFLLFYFFSIGAHPASPFFGIYQMLYEHVFLFAIFRDPYKSVGVINLLYAIGATFLLVKLFKIKKLYRVTFGMLFGSIILLSFGYLRGDVYRSSELLSIPSYVYDLANWNKENEEVFESKKLLMPHQPFPLLSFASYPGKGGPFYQQMLNGKSIQSTAQFTPYIDQIQSLAQRPDFHKFVGFYGIPYIIVTKDFDNEMYPTLTSDKLFKTFDSKLQNVAQFGSQNQIKVYKIDKQYLNKNIYIANRFVLASRSAMNANIISLPMVFENQPDNSFAFATKDDIGSLTIPYSQKNTPSIHVNKKSNVEYDLIIKNLESDFLLVFNETFNNGWILKDKFSFLHSYSFPHLRINGTMNGFVIQKDKVLSVKSAQINKNSENIELSLIFLPQMYFYIGLLLSGLTIVFLLGYYIIVKFKIVK